MLSTVNAPNSNLRAFRKQDVKLKLSKIKNINILFVKFLKCVWIAIFGTLSNGESKYIQKIR